MTSSELLVVVFLCLCIITLFAFTAGRRTGIREGRQQALVEAPVRLRMDALKTGKCPICNERR